MRAIMETLFDAAYLFVILFLGISILKKSSGSKQFRLFGIMALVLGGGDAFHLVPRAIAALSPFNKDFAMAMGIGKMITSVTMTVFYLILFFVWRLRYQVQGRKGLTALMASLAAVRIALCLFPQNEWLSPHPPLLWGILRNIPFAAMGIMMILLFMRSARKTDDRPFRFMALTIALSFLFYVPVVLFAEAWPPVGALMIPKTMAYVWSVWIGFAAMRRENGLEQTQE